MNFNCILFHFWAKQSGWPRHQRMQRKAAPSKGAGERCEGGERSEGHHRPKGGGSSPLLLLWCCLPSPPLEGAAFSSPAFGWGAAVPLYPCGWRCVTSSPPCDAVFPSLPCWVVLLPSPSFWVVVLSAFLLSVFFFLSFVFVNMNVKLK